MNKYMKKLAAGLLAFALMVMLLPAGVVVSFAASGKLLLAPGNSHFPTRPFRWETRYPSR